MNSKFVAQTGVIAAVYAAATLICMLFLSGLAWGPIQFRLSEALTVVALFTPAAVPGLTIGCALANLLAIPLMGTGTLGLLDVVFGSLATLLGSLFMRKFKDRPLLALAGPIIANALIVPLYLPVLLKGLGFYTIPFTDIALDNYYGLMYLFGVVALAFGEAVVVYVLGYPLYKALAKTQIFAESDAASSSRTNSNTHSETHSH